MAQKKQLFRFRIPWLTGSSAARPKDRAKSSTKPDTNVPIQQPPPPPRPAPTPRVEPQQPSPPRPRRPETTSLIIESSATSQSESSSSPRSKTPSPVTSPPPSPSRTATQSQPSLLSPSPSHVGSPSRVSIASSSPKTQPQSPSHLASGQAIEVSKPTVEEGALPASSASEQEKDMMEISEPMPQEAEPEVKSPFKTIPKSPETSFQPEPTGQAIKVPKPTAEESALPASSASEQEKEKMEISEPKPQEAEPKVKSPLKTIPKSPETSFQPEPTGQAIEVPKPTAEESALPASSASEQEKEKMEISEPKPQEVEPKVKSPLKTITKSPETSFQPKRVSTQPTGFEPQPSSMPSSPISKTEPASQPHTSSPLALEGTTSELLKPTAEESTLPQSPASQQEKGKIAASEAVSQESEPKMKSPLKTISRSPHDPEKISTQPTIILGDKEKSPPPKTDKLELDNAIRDSKAPLEAQSKLLQSEEKEKVVYQPTEVGKGKDKRTEQPIRRTKDQFARAFRADKKQRGTVERKMMFATSTSSEKDIRGVSSASTSASTDPETTKVSSISPERPVEKAPLQKGIKDDISKFVHKLSSTVNPTQSLDDGAVSVVTLAGDNRGATMHIGSDSAKKEGSIHIHRDYKTNPEESTAVTTDGEENSRKGSQGSTQEDEVEKAYVNSNIQSINNSLMFHGSITEEDPGVQVTLPQNPAEPIKPDDKRCMETREAEFNVSRAEKLT